MCCKYNVNKVMSGIMTWVDTASRSIEAEELCLGSDIARVQIN